VRTGPNGAERDRLGAGDAAEDLQQGRAELVLGQVLVGRRGVRLRVVRVGAVCQLARRELAEVLIGFIDDHEFDVAHVVLLHRKRAWAGAHAVVLLGQSKRSIKYSAVPVAVVTTKR
jgi:hypothetical protein